jgi:hypoxanthine phosphoribosyltransferase
MMNKEYGLHDYKMDFNKVVQQIRDSNKNYELIIGIQRGGLIPGVHLSHVLDVPFETLHWSSEHAPWQDLLEHKDKQILLVDDICDSGATLHEVLTHFSNFKMDTATLIYNNINKYGIIPTYYGWEINRNEVPQWFDFWWEKEIN